MKKYFNKALLYQSFYNGKWGIIGGSVLIGLYVYISMINSISSLRNNVSYLNMNTLYTSSFTYVLLVCLFLFGIYVFITGFNKRNNITFITSGPYTREEIKRNEFLFLLGALILFTLICAYVMICLFIKNKELLTYTFGEWRAFFFTISKVFIIGLAFITYLSFMDMLFSNLIVTILSLFMLPILVILDISIIGNLYFYNFPLGSVQSFIYNIYDNLHYIYNITMRYIAWDQYFYEDKMDIITPIALLLAMTILLYIISKYINKKITINNVNKFFAFPIVGKIALGLGVFSGILFISSGIFFSIIYDSNGRLYLNGFAYIIAVTFIIAIAIIIGYFAQKILLKILNKYI